MCTFLFFIIGHMELANGHGLWIVPVLMLVSCLKTRKKHHCFLINNLKKQTIFRLQCFH